jgi:hypothetical protein
MFTKENEYEFVTRIYNNCLAIDEEEELPEIEDFDSKADRLYDEAVAKEINS